MNLYLLTQNEVSGYDTYDSVVAAEQTDERVAKALIERYTNYTNQTG